MVCFRLNASMVVNVKLIHPVVFVAIVYAHVSLLAQDVKNTKVKISSARSNTLRMHAYTTPTRSSMESSTADYLYNSNLLHIF